MTRMTCASWGWHTEVPAGRPGPRVAARRGARRAQEDGRGGVRGNAGVGADAKFGGHPLKLADNLSQDI